jgi:uncharacterized membrane-anchored protein YjiN (DUF445 family)
MSERAPAPASSADLASTRRLRRMRLVATGLLIAMAALLAAASSLSSRYPWLGAVRAFAEAALVGGLADWFAVTALFRRPLGLPIPHTAIVPSRKDEIGRALARFIRDHFLVREAIARRLENAGLARRLGGLLDEQATAARVSRDLATALGWLLDAGDGGVLKTELEAALAEIPARLPADAVAATLLEVLTEHHHEQVVIDELVALGRAELERHRVDLRVRIHERSPWWLPRFVDQEIYDQLIRELERIFNDVRNDPQHPARTQFHARLKALQASLTADPEFAAKARTLLEAVLEHPAVREYAAGLWARTSDSLHASLTDPASDLRRALQREIQRIGRLLGSDTEAAAHLDAWLKQLLLYIVENYRDPLSEIVSETIERWDPAATAERVEAQIGRDLQFIRVNGTLVGGCVGLVLYLGARLAA